MALRGCIIIRSSRLQMLFKIGVGLKACKCFPEKFPKFLITLFFTEQLWWLFLDCEKPIPLIFSTFRIFSLDFINRNSNIYTGFGFWRSLPVISSWWNFEVTWSFNCTNFVSVQCFKYKCLKKIKLCYFRSVTRFTRNFYYKIFAKVKSFQ